MPGPVRACFSRIWYCLRTRTSLILTGGSTTRTSTRSLSLAVFCSSSTLMRKFCCSSSFRMFEVVVREEDVTGVLGLADGAQAAHRGLQHEDLGLRLAEQAHAEQRAAVPALAALVDQQDELLLRAFGVEAVELADVVVGGQLFVADVDQDARGRDAVLEPARARRPASARSVSSSMVAAKKASLGSMPSGRRLLGLLQEALDGDVDELVGAGVAVAVQHHLLEVSPCRWPPSGRRRRPPRAAPRARRRACRCSCSRPPRGCRLRSGWRPGCRWWCAGWCRFPSRQRPCPWPAPCRRRGGPRPRRCPAAPAGAASRSAGWWSVRLPLPAGRSRRGRRRRHRRRVAESVSPVAPKSWSTEVFSLRWRLRMIFCVLETMMLKRERSSVSSDVPASSR